MSWKDYGWSEDYEEPSLSDLDPRGWNPFDFSWDQSMFNPNNPEAAKDWFWFDVGVGTSLLLYGAGAAFVGPYAAWNSLGGALMSHQLRRIFIVYPRLLVGPIGAGLAGVALLNEMSVQSAKEGPIVGGGTGSYSGTGTNVLIGDDEVRFSWSEGFHMKPGMTY